MKKIKYIIGLFLLVVASISCQDEDFSVGDLIAPSNLQIDVIYLDDGVETAAPGLGSGTVKFVASGDNVISYQFVYNGVTEAALSGNITYDFSVTGLNTYTVTVMAFGTGGISTTKTIEVEVLALYEPPADLLEMLIADGSRTWRIKAEVDGHFGLGPVGGINGPEWFAAAAFSKEDRGMYDDRYIFAEDGTFTHITDNTNDDPDVNTEGTVFGRINLIDELAGPGGTFEEPADIINYPFSDYNAQWALSAPGGAETLSLTGTAFMGYYTGGDHKYQIMSRSADEMVLRTTDGNNEFGWWFTLVAEEEI